MAQGQPLEPIPLLLAMVNGALYLTFGLVMFRLAERETKRRGKLGGY